MLSFGPEDAEMMSIDTDWSFPQDWVIFVDFHFATRDQIEAWFDQFKKDK